MAQRASAAGLHGHSAVGGELSEVYTTTYLFNFLIIIFKYACCGLNSAEDYIRIARAPPASCCKESNCINPLNLYLTGCLPKVEEAFADEAAVTKYHEYGLLAFGVSKLKLS